MAGRNVEVRNVESYARDVKTLLRLRTAVMIDSSLDATRQTETVETIDKLVKMIQLFASELK